MTKPRLSQYSGNSWRQKVSAESPLRRAPSDIARAVALRNDMPPHARHSPNGTCHKDIEVMT